MSEPKNDAPLFRITVDAEATPTVVWKPAHVYAGHFIPGRLNVRVGCVQIQGMSYATARALIAALAKGLPDELAVALEISIQQGHGKNPRKREVLPASEPAVENTATVLDFHASPHSGEPACLVDREAQ